MREGANRRGTASTIQQRLAALCTVETVSIDRKTQSSIQCSHSLLTLAEREWAASLSAANGRFGPDEVQQAVEDWMQRLEVMGARLATRITNEITNDIRHDSGRS
jgi:hypothetical protein